MRLLFWAGSVSNHKANLKLRFKTMCIVDTIIWGKAAVSSPPLLSTASS